MMAQNRKPPAYQEYASELLANKHFRLMSLAERGLLYTLKLECWANNTVPSKTEALSKYLGISLSEVNDALSAEVKVFIVINGDDLTIPELDDYRKHLTEIREKQSKGGKAGAKITNKKRLEATNYNNGQHFDDSTGDSTTNPTGSPSSNSTVNSQPPRQGSNESLVEFNQAKSRKAQSINNGDTLVTKEHQDWANEYNKASNGD